MNAGSSGGGVESCISDICDRLRKNQPYLNLLKSILLHKIIASYIQEVYLWTVSLLPNVSGSAFWRAYCQPCDVMIKRMVPMKGTNWVAIRFEPNVPA